MKLMMEQRGYGAMLNLLKSRQTYKPSYDLGKLLEELALGPDGLPSDAVRADWNDAVKSAFSSGDEPLTGLHLS